MTPEELMWIAVATSTIDGDTPEYRRANQLRSMVPAFNCYCDSTRCVIQRATALYREWEGVL